MHFLVAFGLLVALILGLTFLPAIVHADCPGSVYGTNSSNTVKYFSSPLCVPCWAQKAEIEKLAKTRGTEFLIEEFDADLCAAEAAPNHIAGTPTFIKNNTVIYGYHDATALAEAFL